VKPDTLHILRNPNGWDELEVRNARLDAADEIERLKAYEIIGKYREATIERLRAEVERQAALLKQCKEALNYHMMMTRPITQTTETLAALEEYERDN